MFTPPTTTAATTSSSMPCAGDDGDVAEPRQEHEAPQAGQGATTTKAKKTSRWTGSPTIRAASGLEPIAYSRRP